MLRRSRVVGNSVRAGIAALADAAATTAEEPPVESSPLTSTAHLKPVVTKVVSEPLNYLRLERVDEATVASAAVVSKTALVTWLYPARLLQRLVHARYQVEAFGKCEATGEPLGMLSIVVGRTAPVNLTGWKFNDFFLKPHEVINMRVVVADQFHWKRTVWSLGLMTNSSLLGAVTRHLFETSASVNGDIRIDAALNVPAAERAARRAANGGVDYRCVSSFFTMEIDELDGAPDLISMHARTTPCFTDNESALATLALPRETLVSGLGGTVVRQPMRSPVVNMAQGKLVSFKPAPAAAEALQGILCGPLPTHEPFAVWLADEIGECVYFTPESGIETENEPDTTHLSVRMSEHRFQARALGRRAVFLDTVRGRYYSDGAS